MKPAIKLKSEFEIIVVGGGHAGIEAALACARMQHTTLLITTNIGSIGRMSCNPAIGGTAKGHLVREIDALGGEMGKIADHTGIHFRMLNSSKGPAVWSPRCQSDRAWYAEEARQRVINQKNLKVIEDTVAALTIKDDRIVGVYLKSKKTISCSCLILCTGTFLGGLMFTGTNSKPGGRYGEKSSKGITNNLIKHGLMNGRLKTGTPPRIDINSIKLSDVSIQHGDIPATPFSFQNKRIKSYPIQMFLTYTNRKTHRTLEGGFSESPLFTGRIKGIGPRYCPSIEDKIVRFSEKERHQIFLEPEGYNTHVVYVNGFSTSLPEHIQVAGLKTIDGLNNVKMLRPGYAIEYDFFPPHQLRLSLESKFIDGLFFAGQINGTSGYEEAAAQGLIAGINASLKLENEPPFILKRSEAYIGVLIDDLINKSTDEPYRMFTSRAEYRLLLRQDNADQRLMGMGYKLGLISDGIHRKLLEKIKFINEGIKFLDETSISPNIANPFLESLRTKHIDQNVKLTQLVLRPEVHLSEMIELEEINSHPFIRELSTRFDEKYFDDIIQQVEIDVKYAGYIKRQTDQIKKFENQESIPIPENYDFKKIKSLSSEGKEKLCKIKPTSVGQASRISGVTNADISILLVHLRR